MRNILLLLLYLLLSIVSQVKAQTLSFPNGATTAAGSSGTLQYNNGGVMGGISRVTSNGTNMFLTNTTLPQTATTDKAVVYSRTELGYSLPNVDTDLDSSALLAVTSPSFIAVHSGVVGAGNTSIISNGVSVGVMGTQSSPAINLDDAYSASKRIVCTTSTINTLVGVRHNAAYMIRATSVGGFAASIRFALNNNSANNIGFIGLDTMAPVTSTTIVFNDMLACVGVGWDQNDANLSLVHNDGSGTVTKTALGANFPINNKGLYNLKITSVPNVNGFYWSLTNYSNGSTASGLINTNMPVGASLLCPKVWALSKVAALTSVEFLQIYVQTY